MKKIENRPQEKKIKICPHCKKEIDSAATKCSHCQSDLREWWNRHPVLTGLGVLFFISIIFSGVHRGNGTSTTDNQSQISTPTDPAVLAADKNRLAELKTKFNYTYDQFQKVGWYQNKSQADVNTTFNKEMLSMMVNDTGYAYLEDQYYGSDWIFHTRVEVSIGGIVYKSVDVPTYDPKNATQNASGSVWERISYVNGKDNGVIKAIAESGNTPVSVRFAGEHGVYDFTLSSRDQQAIEDAYELSTLIKEVGN